MTKFFSGGQFFLFLHVHLLYLKVLYARAMVFDVVFWSLHRDLFPANLFNKSTECSRIKM